MNYNRLYRRFIESRPQRTRQRNDGLETHHILPRSLGGDNSKQNLIDLTAREHWLAHRILYHMTTGKDRSKMAYALVMMSGTGKYDLTARQYERIRGLNSQTTQKQWRDPEYRAKQSAYRNSEERRAISRKTMLALKERGIVGRRGKVDPVKRLIKLQAKYGSNPTSQQRHYLKQVAKQI